MRIAPLLAIVPGALFWTNEYPLVATVESISAEFCDPRGTRSQGAAHVAIQHRFGIGTVFVCDQGACVVYPSIHAFIVGSGSAATFEQALVSMMISIEFSSMHRRAVPRNEHLKIRACQMPERTPPVFWTSGIQEGDRQGNEVAGDEHPSRRVRYPYIACRD